MSAKQLILLMALLIMCALPGCANDASTDTEIGNIENEELEFVESVEASENEPSSSEDESETNPMDDQTQEKETETEINEADSEDKKQRPLIWASRDMEPLEEVPCPSSGIAFS